MVRHTPKQMFDLVNDFERYPEFLPGCRRARLLEKDESHLIGEMTLGRAGIELVVNCTSHRFGTPLDRTWEADVPSIVFECAPPPRQHMMPLW